MRHVYFPTKLGVRREGATEAAQKLQKLPVISYRRGLLRVLDRQKLEALSCECYDMVETETDCPLDYRPQRQVIINPETIPVATRPTLKG